MKKQDSSYNQILKAASIFGGSQVVNIILGIVRTKFIAILLGPLGIGLIGVFQSILDVIRSFSGLAIETGTIKEVAKAKDNNQELRRTTSVLRFWFIITAIFGGLLCVLFCYPLSIWAFGSEEYTLGIALLSIAVFFTTISAGRFAIMQGLRKISYLAKITILGGFLGLIFIIPAYYLWGVDAITPALILNSLIVFACTGFYFRKLSLHQIEISKQEAVTSGFKILKIGLFVVIGGVINTVSMFLVRTYISQTIDMTAVGLFQSAWVITSVYVGLIIGATGTDYFPRLSAIVGKKDETNKLINEQTHIILIIAAPIIVGMLLFSSLAIYLLYSSDFSAAKDILQWQILGTYFKILATPLAAVLLAKNKGILYVMSEIVFFAVYLLCSYLLAPYWGVSAAGMGYLVAYVVYLVLIFAMVRKVMNFRWNGEVLKIIGMNILFISIACYLNYGELQYSSITGVLLLILTVAYSFFKLKKIFSLNDLKGWFKKKE